MNNKKRNCSLRDEKRVGLERRKRSIGLCMGNRLHYINNFK